MHARISVNAISCPGCTFRERRNNCLQLSASRVSFVSTSSFEEGLPAAHDALAYGSFKVETIVHPAS